MGAEYNEYSIGLEEAWFGGSMWNITLSKKKLKLSSRRNHHVRRPQSSEICVICEEQISLISWQYSKLMTSPLNELRLRRKLLCTSLWAVLWLTPDRVGIEIIAAAKSDIAQKRVPV